MAETIQVLPTDEWNTRLVDNVHPPTWQNPTPEGRYNLVVLGAGTGGLITALIASSLGAKVALVERHLMGGDCLNVGCVPSKAVIRGAQVVHEARDAARFGMPAGADDVADFDAVMRRMREIRARISHEDSAERYSEEFGIDVYMGEARFVSDGRVEVRPLTEQSHDWDARVVGVLPILTTRVDGDLLDRFPRVRVVSNMAVGVVAE